MKKYLSLILSGLTVLLIPLAANAQTIQGLVGNIATAAKAVMGGIVIIAWVVVAILFLTAWGSPERLGTAKKAFIWTLVGTVIAVLFASIGIIIENAILRGQ